MKQSQFISLLMWLVFLANMTILLLVIVLSLPAINAFLMDSDTPALFKVLLPIMALYLGPITYYVVRHKHDLHIREHRLNRNYVLFVAAMILMHMGLIIAFLLLYAFSIIKTLKSLLLLIGTVEAAFGTYIGLIVRDLFKQKAPR